MRCATLLSRKPGSYVTVQRKNGHCGDAREPSRRVWRRPNDSSTNDGCSLRAGRCAGLKRCSDAYWHVRFDLQTCGEWQSLLLPQGRPAPQFGAQGCGTHTAFRQIFDPQFPLSLHAIPLPQFGEQAGAWQSPDMQIPVPQSPPIPQGLPVGHLPGWVAQTGDLHKFDPHTKDAQFELLLHNDPFPQLGEQAGGAHRPCTQTFDPQSLSDPHGLF